MHVTDATLDQPSSSATTRRMRVLINPHSGAKGGLPTNRTEIDDVRAALDAAGIVADVVVTESEEEAIAATRDAIQQGYDIVAAAGGDGTIGTVACELLHSQTALGVLPLGSVMNIARMLAIPRDIDEAVQVLAQGEVRAIDVGEANGQIFFEGGSVGLNAAVFREAQGMDAAQGRVGALLAALRELVRYRPPRMILHLDDTVFTTRALAVSVANGPYAGLGFTVSPEASIEDGLLNVVVYSRFSRTELIRHFGAIAFGRRQYTAKIRTFTSRRVRIDGVHPLPCRADAHDLGETPVEYIVRPRALRVIAPVLGAAPE
jgi:diacylglycerol kinase (ATP)